MKGLDKELILKYKTEFDSWLKDEKSIIMGYNKSKTLDIEIEWLDYIDWTFPSGIFIINDKYVEFRKALAEGKTIQCNAREGENDITYIAYGHTWWADTTEFKYATRFYRIKPEEEILKNKFDSNDWVHIPSLDTKPCKYRKDLCHLGLEKWIPKIGERSWFSNSLDEEPVLSRLQVIRYTDDTKTEIMWYYAESNTNMVFYKFCQPFICELPIGMNDD